MIEEKTYKYGDYVVSYVSYEWDPGCLTISKIQNDNMYVIGEIKGGIAEIIDFILDSVEDEISKYESKLDKIKEYVKNNEKCVVECSGRDFMTGMPYEKIKTGLIEKARIEELLEKIE